MKNIAILVPTLNKGGAERVAANMSLAFAKHYNVYLIVHDGSDPVYPHGGRLIDLRLPPAGTRIGKIAVSPLPRPASVASMTHSLTSLPSVLVSVP